MDQAFTNIPTKEDVVAFYNFTDKQLNDGLVVKLDPQLYPDHEAHVCNFPRLILAPIKGVSQFACGHIVEGSKVTGFEDVTDNLAFRND